MAIEISVPQLGESIVEATVGAWRKHEGDAVTAGEAVVELETDKVNLEVSAPRDGTLAAILKPEGATVTAGEALATLDLSPNPSPAREGGPDGSAPALARGGELEGSAEEPAAIKRGGGAGVGMGASGSASRPEERDAAAEGIGQSEGARATPLARRMAADHGIDLAAVRGTGPGGRITHEDVTAMIATAPNGASAPAVARVGGAARAGSDVAPAPVNVGDGGGHGRATQPASNAAPSGAVSGAAGTPAMAAPRTESRVSTAPAAETVAGGAAASTNALAARPGANGAREERVRMSRRRQTIARRLVEAQHTAAMLTTFNEVDMSAIMELRKRRRDQFKERHGVGLGFMSFFTRAVVGALKAYPRLNAELQGDEMVLKHYYDIGIAVSTDEGLVVPVVRDADRRTFAEIEREIAALAEKARNLALSLDDLQGGTFTITNGGVFGSLLSTPILNGPQVGILGMHKIQERPIAVAGQVVIHPMMYVAVSYDHRIVDGAESVSFLVRVKELLEDPETLLLEG